MCQANAVGDATMLGYSKVDGVKSNAGGNVVEIMNYDGPEEVKGKIDIVVRKKQIDVDNKIYYPPEREQNPDNAK